MPFRTRRFHLDAPPWRRWLRRAGWIALVAGVAGAALLAWGFFSGRRLIREDVFGHVPWAVVLSGEGRDLERTAAAARLYREGRIDRIAISSTRLLLDRHWGEFTRPWLATQGVPPNQVFELRHDAWSTLEEASFLLGQFRRLGVDTVVVITSNYHSARARRIFRHLADGDPVCLVAVAEGSGFAPNAFWHHREGRKTWLLETMKSLHTAWELWFDAGEYQSLLHPDSLVFLPSSPLSEQPSGTDSTAVTQIGW